MHEIIQDNLYNQKTWEILLEVMDDLYLMDYFRFLNNEKTLNILGVKTSLKQGRVDFI